MPKGRKPGKAAGQLREPTEPPDYNEATPKFCLSYLRDGFDVHALDERQQAALPRHCRSSPARNGRN